MMKSINRLRKTDNTIVGWLKNMMWWKKMCYELSLKLKAIKYSEIFT